MAAVFCTFAIRISLVLAQLAIQVSSIMRRISAYKYAMHLKPQQHRTTTHPTALQCRVVTLPASTGWKPFNTCGQKPTHKSVKSGHSPCTHAPSSSSPPACGIYLAYKASVGYSSYGSRAEKQKGQKMNTRGQRAARTASKRSGRRSCGESEQKGDKRNKNRKKPSEKIYRLEHWPRLYSLMNLLKRRFKNFIFVIF